VLPKQWENATISRLTSPGVNLADNITFAGQHVDSNAQIVGKKTIENIVAGKVLVGAGEAVLIKL
jgi:hypothetical protein